MVIAIYIKVVHLFDSSLKVQEWIHSPGAPSQSIDVDILHGNPGYEPCICLLHILITLLDAAFCQETQSNTNVFLCPPLIQNM